MVHNTAYEQYCVYAQTLRMSNIAYTPKKSSFNHAFERYDRVRLFVGIAIHSVPGNKMSFMVFVAVFLGATHGVCAMLRTGSVSQKAIIGENSLKNLAKGVEQRSTAKAISPGLENDILGNDIQFSVVLLPFD